MEVSLKSASIIIERVYGFIPEDVEKIQTEGHKGPTAAAKLFLQIIVNLTEDGWFRGFLDALNEAGLVYAAIRNHVRYTF